MKNPFTFLGVLVLSFVVFYLYRRSKAAAPTSIFGGMPVTQAQADEITLRATYNVQVPSAQMAWQAGDTISLGASPSSGDFFVQTKQLGLPTPPLF